MTVKTEVKTLDHQWYQLVDGVTAKFVQVKQGTLEYVIADALPAIDVKGHDTGLGFKATPPTQIWGRSRFETESVTVAISPTDETGG